jgi:GT2 family glycosyltransferase
VAIAYRSAAREPKRRRKRESPRVPRYAVAIVNYKSYDDLADCLASLEAQEQEPACIAVVDHDPDPEQAAALEARFPKAVFLPRPNHGYASGANRALALCAQLAPGAEYRLLLNPDVALDPDFARRVIDEMDARPAVALASGKLLRADGATLDSTGIARSASRVFTDRGSDRRDDGQFEQIERVFALSGAALLIRSAAISVLEIHGELFDEDFFAYHEDTDLAWRAHLLGMDCLYVPTARALHRRGWQAARWREIEPAVRRHSFKNRYLEMLKNERARDFLLALPAILWQELVRFGGALLVDRARLPAYADVLRLARRALRKRRIIHERARALSH